MRVKKIVLRSFLYAGHQNETRRASRKTSRRSLEEASVRYGVLLCELDRQLFLLLAAMILNACGMAEFGEDNGMNLYADHNYAIKKLAVLSTQGLVDNSFFVKAAGIAQDTPNGPPTGEEISWAKICVARLPDPVISKLLAQAPLLSYMYLDGLPPG